MNRIDGNQLSQLQSQPKKSESAEKKVSANVPPPADNTQAAPASQDSVKISDAGRQLNELEKNLESKAFDEQKVALIKQAIGDGTYKPDARLIAEKMFSMDN